MENEQNTEQQVQSQQQNVEQQNNNRSQQNNKRKSKNKELTKHKVDSTNLDWIAYDEDKKDLYIQFRSGGLYKYSDVPKDIFEGLLNSGSKGRYHNVKIKYKYKYEKLN